MNRRWVLACALAETVGMAASAGAARAAGPLVVVDLRPARDQGPVVVGPDAVAAPLP